MDVKNCYWEVANLGKKTVEVDIARTDTFYSGSFLSLDNEYDYHVVKIPMNKLDFVQGLTQLGYSLIETQINILTRPNEFDFKDKLIRAIIDDVDFTLCKNAYDFQDIVSRIEPGMFSTDRVSLDPYFGMEIGMKRYVNWMNTEFKNQTSTIIKIFYKGEHVGFGMFRDGGRISMGFLSGIYSDVDAPIGILTSTYLPIFCKKYHKRMGVVKSSISSNNIPVFNICNYFRYKIKDMRYVFIKHVD